MLRPERKADDSEAGADAARVDERRASYQLEVDAPRALRALLADNLDLARFRAVPASEGLSDEELDRLIAAAPEQARTLLRTEGYFNAQVDVAKEPAPAGERPRIVVRVTPGPQTRVDSVNLDVQGELKRRADAGDKEAGDLVAQLRTQWPLKPGEAFRQADWAGAKSSTLARMHAQGYPAAAWLETEARVRSRDQQVQLQLAADSGPRFHLGELRVEGTTRYEVETVRNLAALAPGVPYSEQQLLDVQERLRRSGLFEGAVAEIDPNPQNAAAAPVTVRVQEHPLQRVTLGVGYSTDTGVRGTLEHIHRRPFGLRWVARSNLELGPRRKLLDVDLRSYPKAGLWRNLAAGRIERWSGPDEERSSRRLRVGRSQEDIRRERLYYLELNHARVRTPLEVSEAQALSANHDWTRRDVDSLLLPTRGNALLLQGALGYARSITADNGPFARAYGRLLWFKPFGRDWYARVRVEAGQLFAGDAVGVPDTLLFRAGGEESVRGYEFRSLGPMVNGVVTSGRSLLTTSVEIARPISQRMPQLWGAGFIDAGNAARRFSDLRPVVGLGVGVRYRSPVGPLQADLAYGVDAKRFRMHLSAGVTVLGDWHDRLEQCRPSALRWRLHTATAAPSCAAHPGRRFRVRVAAARGRGGLAVVGAAKRSRDGMDAVAAAGCRGGAAARRADRRLRRRRAGRALRRRWRTAPGAARVARLGRAAIGGGVGVDARAVRSPVGRADPARNAEAYANQPQRATATPAAAGGTGGAVAARG